MKHVYKLFIVSFIIISFLIVGLPSNSFAKGKVKTLIITTCWGCTGNFMDNKAC
ncbi:MAG: hypothetical protein JRI44_11685 [Deltaproteobacteria bacterium]|nr:hypothetical protein [Deltaproteobacteria bacterium]